MVIVDWEKMTKKNYWDSLLKDYWLSHRKATAWKVVYFMVEKYKFIDIKVRGFPALEPAKQILAKYKDKLTNQEIDFLEKVVKGEYIK
jgi:hypothetical protein